MTTPFRLISVGVVAALLVLAGCDCSDGHEQEASEDEAEVVEADEETAQQPAGPNWNVKGLDLPDVSRPYTNILAASQPSQEQFSKLGELDVKTVINLREDGEEDSWDPSEKAAEMGIEYVHIPISETDAEELSRENVELFHEAIAEKEGEFLIYCGSSDRVGAMIALRAKWSLDASTVEALRRGRVAGLDELESAVRSELYK